MRRRTHPRPGSERFRDEKRSVRTPRMHGGRWHDHRPKEVVPTGVSDALPEAESSGEREGMGKGKSHGSGRGSRK
jgi:hypothetical protein